MSPASPDRRVVITGVGVVSPLGNSVAAFWQSLVAGRSGVDRLAADPAYAELPFCAGRVTDFTGRIEDFGPLEGEIKRTIRKSLKLMNRETQMAVAATQQALADAGHSGPPADPDRVGVCFGAGNVSMLPEDFVAGVEVCSNGAGFDFGRWGSDGLPQVAPIWLLKCLPNMPACHIAMYNDFRGPNNSITQHEAAANIALAEARSLIAEGAADVVITGGTGTTLFPYNLLHVHYAEELATAEGDPAAACRPFDRQRRGAALGEAAAAFVLESLDSAVRRGAAIYGEVLGGGSSCVVDRNSRPQRRQAVANAMQSALRNTQTPPEAIDHVNAHGLGTRRSDVDEAHAIRDVFGKRAASVPVVALKGSTGNAGAGSGALEILASLLALRKGVLFPVRNCEHPDPECPISPVVAREEMPAGSCFVNVNFLPQGQASALVIRAAA